MKASGTSLMREGKNDEAGVLLRRASKADPDNPTLHKMLGASLANSGEMDSAAKEYRRYLEIAAPNEVAEQIFRALFVR